MTNNAESIKNLIILYKRINVLNKKPYIECEVFRNIFIQHSKIFNLLESTKNKNLKEIEESLYLDTDMGKDKNKIYIQQIIDDVKNQIEKEMQNYVSDFFDIEVDYIEIF